MEVPAVTLWLLHNAVFFIFTTLHSTEASGFLPLPVYRHYRDSSKFLYQKDLPEMTELTICFWLSTNINTFVQGDRKHLFSIANKDSSNEFLISICNNDPTVTMEMRVQNSAHKVVDLTIEEGSALFMGWSKHCFFWDEMAGITWFADSEVPGELKFQHLSRFQSASVRPGGALMMLNDQDEFFGGIDEDESIEGKIAWINMWDRAMSEEEIKALGCRDKGNIVNMDTLSTMGTPAFHSESFPCKETELVPFQKTYQPMKQQMVFCRKAGKRLAARHIVLSVTASSPAGCLKSCVQHSDCLSAKYNTRTGSCKLQNATGLDHPQDILVDAGESALFTSAECAG